MLKTLRLSFAMKNTYRVNGILYAIKQIPLIRRILPYDIYKVHGFKVFANVLSVLWEICTVFLGKMLYFLLMVIAPLALYELPPEREPAVFLHIFVLLTVIGAFANSYMFNPTKDKYYAMILLGMDAREYTLVNYIYAHIKLILGFTLCGFLFGSLSGLAAWQCILLPLFAVGVKTVWAAYDLREYERTGAVKNENKLDKVSWIAMAVLLAAAYGLPVIGVVLPEIVSVILMGIGILAGFVGIPKILRFRHYRALYKELLTESLTLQMDKSAQVKLQQAQVNKMISTDTTVTSSKSGFAYLNELFIKRHQKILWKSAEKITIGALAVLAVGIIAVLFFPEAKEGVNKMLLNALPYFVFIMYLINRGVGFTRALFVNCDHSLLTYPFYKKPGNILRLFRIRLWEITKINLLPALVIGAGLALLLFLSGGTDNPINYVLIFVTITALSIFFSVHYLTLYYLIQPYNAGTEIKSGTYQIVIWLTYMICYMMIQIKLPTLYFGLAAIVFCVLYSAVASVLVYKLAPKTFRIRT